MLTTLPDLKAAIFKDMMKYTKELLGRIQVHFKSFSLVFFSWKSAVFRQLVYSFGEP